MGRGKWEWGRVVSAQPSPRSKGDLYDIDLEIVLTGQDAPGPPAPPFHGPAIAALIDYHASGNPAITTESFSYNGDDVGAGYAGLPTVGPLTAVEGTAPDFGITATRAMTVRISAECWINGVWTATETATVNVRVNGAVVGTTSYTGNAGGGIIHQLLIDVHDVVLAAGDVVTMDSSVANDGWLGTIGDKNIAAKNSSMLIVGRGTHTNVPGASYFGTTWVGP